MWTLNAAGGGQLFSGGTINFSGIESLRGGNQNDHFVFNVLPAAAAVMVYGRGLQDHDIVDLSTIVGVLPTVQVDNPALVNIEEYIGNNTGALAGINNTASSTWVINGNNSGTVTNDGGPTIVFSSFNSLIGGGVTDAFTLAENGSLSGLIDGGNGNDDSVTVTAPGDLTVELGNRSTANLNVYNVETITANTVTNNTLRGNNVINNWLIDANNSGTVNDGITDVRFNDFNNLTGGNANDTFSFNGANGSISGLIDGGAHVTRDEVSFSGVSGTVLVDLSQTNRYRNIEYYTGNGDTSALRGSNGGNTWAVIDANRGNVNGIGFDAFHNLTGGNAQDNFTLTKNGNITGQLLGGTGAGLNTLRIENQAITAVQLGIDADASNNRNLNVDQFNLIAAENMQAGNRLIGANRENFWTIDGLNTGNVNGVVFSHFAILSGSANSDTFFLFPDRNAQVSRLEGGDGTDRLVIQDQAFLRFIVLPTTYTLGRVSGENTLSINSGPVMSYIGIDDVQVIGIFFPFDRVVIDNAIDFGANGRLTLSNMLSIEYTPSLPSAPVISADSLIIQNTRLVGMQNNRLVTNVNNLSITNGSQVYIDEVDQVNLTGLSTSGRTEIRSGSNFVTGGVTSTAALSTFGEVLIDAHGGPIRLAGGNILRGPLNLLGGAIEVTNTTATTLATVAGTNLLLGSSSDIAQTGAEVVSGETRLNSGGNIVLTHADNDFSQLNVLNANILQVTDTNAIASGTMTANSIQLRTRDGIGDTATSVRTATAQLDVINAGAGAASMVNITNNRNVEVVNLRNSGDIKFTNTGGVTLHPSAMSANHGGQLSDLTYAGDINMQIGGFVIAAGATCLDLPDIVAENLRVTATPGPFGVPVRPVVISVHEEFFLFSPLAG